MGFYLVIMKKSTHKIFLFVIRSLIHGIARVDVSGFENLPEGGYVIASNHIGRLDATAAYYVLDRPDIIMVVAEKYQKYAFYRWLVKITDGMFIDRHNADFRAIRETLRRLQKGEILAIAPEGTRSKSGNLIEAKPGGTYLAWKAGVPIIPVALTGTEDALVVQRLKHLKRLKITITAGAAFSLPQEVKGRDRDAAMQQYTDEIMCRIAALLPEDRRGVYANRPRLKELLAEQEAVRLSQ
jgi:1-acyl-sn-glycerol-3-phosphate acyltransferase